VGSGQENPVAGMSDEDSIGSPGASGSTAAESAPAEAEAASTVAAESAEDAAGTAAAASKSRIRALRLTSDRLQVGGEFARA